MADEISIEYDDEESSTGDERHNSGHSGGLLPSTFLKRVVSEVAEQQISAGFRLNTEARGRLAKFWFGKNNSVHYEIWIHDRTMQLEIGLHCESTPEYNALLYKEFDHVILDIQQKLGKSFWLEDWDHGWIRLYETHPLRPLDVSRAEEIAARLLEVVAAVEPYYREILSKLQQPPPPTPLRTSRHGWGNS
jgi:hypothetical protein